MLSIIYYAIVAFLLCRTVNGDCTDGTLRFKITKNDGKKIMRDCGWVSNKNTVGRCSFTGVPSACPSSCGTCSVCEDSTLRFKITKNDGKKIMRNCSWVSNKNTAGRCALDGVALACRDTCGSCDAQPTKSPSSSDNSGPCLRTCDASSVVVLEADILQICINKCMTDSHCCGNRLNGEAPYSSAARLSCANGCEIAFYRSTVALCKADCDVANDLADCSYAHPNIFKPFNSCGDCQEGCDGWPELGDCANGCDHANTLRNIGYYQYEEPESSNTCETENIPRFLFGGQSNMEGWSNQALPGSFQEIVNIVNNNNLSEQQKKIDWNHI